MSHITPNQNQSQEPPVRDFTTRPALGERCRITGIVEKRHSYDTDRDRVTDWLDTPCDKEALYIGWRVVHHGTRVVEGSYGEEYLAFKHKRSYYVWLFVESESKKPFYVFPRNVKRLTNGGQS